MTIRDSLSWADKILTENEVDDAKSSADFLLRNVLKVSRTYLFAHPEIQLSKLQELKYKRWVKKRAKHEPVWYITGTIEFMDLDLHVNTSVLIPRPETELMIEKIISEVRGKNEKLKILDVGTGSGTIILSLAKNLSACHPCEGDDLLRGDRKRSLGLRPGMTGVGEYRFFASDISDKALLVARKNAKTNRLQDRVEFRTGDLLAPWVGEKFDIIVANLPYVPHEDMATLAFDLTHYEPRIALDGGTLGLEVYKRFIQELSLFLNPGAIVYMEIGYDQGRYIEQFVHKYMPEAKVEVQGDYQQIDRIVVIRT